MQKAINEYTFLIFLVFMIAFIIFVGFKVPETKNKTFEEIASQYQRGEDIEVEEAVDDDVFYPYNEDDDEAEPGAADALMAATDEKTSHSSINDLRVGKRNQKEEKRSLTKSEENVNSNNGRVVFT